MPGFTRRRCICGGTYEYSPTSLRTPHRELEQVPSFTCTTCGHWAASRAVIERLTALMADLPEDPASARVTAPDTAPDW
jgi:hypothetical protein